MSKRINGDGSVWKRSDGRWCAAAYVPKVGGGMTRRYVYGRTRADATTKLRELLDKAAKDIPVAPAGLTVETFLTEWLEHVRPRVRPSTWEGYEINVSRHLVPRIGRKKLGKLGPRDVRLMVDEMRTDGLKPRSVQYAHATLRSALEHAFREELVPRNVARLVQVQQPSKEKPTEPMTVEEARTFLRAVADHRLYALWVTVLMLGLRRGEACGLRWDHVDFAARTLRITQSLQRVGAELRELPTKTKRSNRTVPLPARVLYALANHHGAMQAEHGRPGQPWRPEGFVFVTPIGTPLDPRNLTRRFGELLHEHGIRPVRFHDLRHSCVSLLLASGVHPRTVMEIVGHSALEMTMNVYGHVQLDTQRAALDGLDDVLSG